MANNKHLAVLRKGVKAWNQWRIKNPNVIPDLSKANLKGAVLSGANLTWAILGKATLRGADLCNANLTGADLNRANLRLADLSGADLSGAGLGHANVIRANLVGANIQGADLTEVNLHRADLSSTDMRGAAMVGGNLTEVNLREANLSGADLSKANLGMATLHQVNLSHAVFREADLREANLSDVNLSRADLSEADLHNAKMGDVMLTGIDLSEVKGLETVQHGASSCIGIDTIYMSGGNIPHLFLQGAGVPDNFIEYMNSLTGKAFDYYSCFISYSTEDQKFAERLYADLQANGVRCWFAPRHAQGGKKLYEQIDTAIRLHERLLLILSPASINSDWVKTEIAAARQREIREKTRVLFPVLLQISFDELRDWEYFDADIGKSSAQEIREYYIPDFSRWNSYDAYREEFDKLLRDLTKA